MLLVDGDDPGTASAAGAGIVQSLSEQSAPGPLRALMLAGAAHYETLSRLLEADGTGAAEWGYSRPGAMIVAGSPSGAERLAELISAWSGEGLEGAPGVGSLSLLDRPAASGLCPAIRPVGAALLMDGGARVDGRSARAALQRAFARHGGRIVSGRAALGRGRGGFVVEVAGESHHFASVVAALGAWSSESLDPLAPLVAPVMARRGEILHLAVDPSSFPGGPPPQAWPVVTELDHPHYMLGFPGWRAVVGATAEEVGLDPRVTARGLGELAGATARLAPALAAGTFLEARVGLRPVALDGFPLIGEVRSVPGLYIGNGLGHVGLHCGPLAGYLLAQMVCGGDPANGLGLDLSAFDPERGL